MDIMEPLAGEQSKASGRKAGKRERGMKKDWVKILLKRNPRTSDCGCL